MPITHVHELRYLLLSIGLKQEPTACEMLGAVFAARKFAIVLVEECAVYVRNKTCERIIVYVLTYQLAWPTFQVTSQAPIPPVCCWGLYLPRENLQWRLW